MVANQVDQKFEAFHKANPHVYEELKRRAFRLKYSGARRVGMKAIFEAMRYDVAIRTLGNEYKLNNNFTSRYARMLVAEYPTLCKVIELRELRTAA